jgi:hypothetical protein
VREFFSGSSKQAGIEPTPFRKLWRQSANKWAWTHFQTEGVSKTGGTMDRQKAAETAAAVKKSISAMTDDERRSVMASVARSFGKQRAENNTQSANLTEGERATQEIRAMQRKQLAPKEMSARDEPSVMEIVERARAYQAQQRAAGNNLPMSEAVIAVRRQLGLSPCGDVSKSSMTGVTE